MPYDITASTFEREPTRHRHHATHRLGDLARVPSLALLEMCAFGGCSRPADDRPRGLAVPGAVLTVARKNATSQDPGTHSTVYLNKRLTQDDAGSAYLPTNG